MNGDRFRDFLQLVPDFSKRLRRTQLLRKKQTKLTRLNSSDQARREAETAAAQSASTAVLQQLEEQQMDEDRELAASIIQDKVRRRSSVKVKQ